MVGVQQHKWLQETTLLENTKQRARKIDLQHAANLRNAKAEFVKAYDQKMGRRHKEQHTARSILFVDGFFMLQVWRLALSAFMVLHGTCYCSAAGWHR
jgi:predicted choloylglycine hydrolase